MDTLHGGRKIKCKQRWLDVYFQLAVVLCLLQIASGAMTSCGAYIEIGKGSSQFFSPNYPNVYDNSSYCVWVIKAADGYRVSLTLTFTGEKYGGSCSDYITIRNGGSLGSLMGTYCETHTDVVVESTSSYMYIELKTDMLQTTGTYLDARLQANYNTTVVAEDGPSSMPVCRSYQFECANHVCISMSYRCDDYNDCGCIDNCDEDGCGSLDISITIQILIAVFVGIGAFIVVCLLAYLIEGRHNWSAHKKKIKI